MLIGIDPILDRPFHTWKSAPSDSQEAFSLWSRLIGAPFTMIAAKRFLKEGGVRTRQGGSSSGRLGCKLF